MKNRLENIILAVIILMIASTTPVLSQTIAEKKQLKAELLQRIEEFQDCIGSQANPNVHSHLYQLAGQEVPVLQQTDFSKGASRFSQVSPDLGVNVMLMDDRNLSRWEKQEAKQICANYFEGGRGFHIASHGLEDGNGASTNELLIGGKALNPEQTAEMILQCLQNYDILLKYREEPFPIVLHSCKSGQGGDNSFAAKLSSIIAQKIPQAAVIASPELVLCEMDNKGNYNEYVSDRSGSKHGNWLVFQNGKQTMQGTPDYKSTVNKIISNKK